MIFFGYIYTMEYYGPLGKSYVDNCNRLLNDRKQLLDRIKLLSKSTGKLKIKIPPFEEFDAMSNMLIAQANASSPNA